MEVLVRIVIVLFQLYASHLELYMPSLKLHTRLCGIVIRPIPLGSVPPVMSVIQAHHVPQPLLQRLRNPVTICASISLYSSSKPSSQDYKAVLYHE